jgi:CrcB protein
MSHGARASTLGLVVAGGAVGVFARAALLAPVTDLVAVPWVTLAINVIGSLLLGVVVGWLGERHPTARGFLGTGVLGGFTTYSAFAVQIVGLPSLWVAAALAAATLVIGVLAAVFGLFVGRRIADAPGEIEPPEVAE